MNQIKQRFISSLSISLFVITTAMTATSPPIQPTKEAGLAAQPKVSPKEKKQISFDPKKEIVFGQSAFLGAGSLQLYGELIKNGITARFKRENEKGGIKLQNSKKKLKLISLDDGGEPSKTAANIALFKKNNIDMFLGNMGTRSIFKLLPLVEKKEIALLFPWGGDQALRKPTLSHLVNGIGFIEPQLEALVVHALATLQLKKIAIFHDDSTFGNANKNAVVALLKAQGIEPVGITSYNRFTMNIKRPAQKLIEADPKVVISLATTMPTVKLINTFFEAGHYGTRFTGIDSTMFVGNILKRKGIPFYYASPMPHPVNSTLPIVKEFKEDMKKHFPHDPPNILSLAYYIHASIIIEALKKITGPVTKETVLAQIENMKNYSIGGFPVDFNRTTRHAYPQNISILSSLKKQKG